MKFITFLLLGIATASVIPQAAQEILPADRWFGLEEKSGEGIDLEAKESNFVLEAKDVRITFGAKPAASRVPIYNLPKNNIYCGDKHDDKSRKSYRVGDIESAAEEAGRRVISGNQNGNYPHKYEGRDPDVNFPDCRKAKDTLYEYPVADGGRYNGGKPGPDRVVIKRKNKNAREFWYCGLIRHPEENPRDFENCSG